MEEDYKHWPEPLRKAMISLRKASGCGANKEGGGGFQTGNSCAAGGGGGSLGDLSKQTETKEFKDWFGDSKIVEPDGSPKILYTGQPRGLSEFGKTERSELPMSYVFLTDKESVAERYAGTSEQSGDYHTDRDGEVYSVYTKMENPLDLDEPIDEKWWRGKLKDEYGTLIDAFGIEAETIDYSDGEYDDFETIYSLNGVSLGTNKLASIDEIADAKWDALSGSGMTLEYALRSSPTGKMIAMFPAIGEQLVKEGSHDGYVFYDSEMGGKTYVVVDGKQVRIDDRKGRT